MRSHFLMSVCGLFGVLGGAHSGMAAGGDHVMAIAPKKLFKGQNTHPLTVDEKKALVKKITFDSAISTGEKNRIYASFAEMMNYPTGREQIRKVISAPQKKYTIIIKEFNARGVSYGNGNIGVAKCYLDSPKQLGMTILHELLHERQKANAIQVSTFNIDQVIQTDFATEAETKALSAQLEIETNHNADGVLKKNYEKSIEKWRQVAEEKLPRPQNIPLLVYATNLSPTEKEHAKEEYAKLLASLEIRANFIKDYTRPLREYTSPDQSYRSMHEKVKCLRSSSKSIYELGKSYDFLFKNPEGDSKFCDEILQDVISRNSLFLMTDDLKKASMDSNNDKEKIGFMTIAREAQSRFSKGEGKNFTEAFNKIIAEKQKEGQKVEIFIATNNNNQVYEFFDKEMYPAGKGFEGAAAKIKENEAVQKTKILDDNQKIEVLIERIKDSKNENPEPCEERTDAIKRLREMTGSPNLPMVKTTSETSVQFILYS